MMPTHLLPTEHDEQVAFVRWWRLRYPRVRIFAVPNGGLRTQRGGGRLKAEGASAGVPDLHVPAMGLWIEMKRREGGRLSQAQRDWKQYLESLGHDVIVAAGCSEAIKQVEHVMQRQV